MPVKKNWAAATSNNPAFLSENVDTADLAEDHHPEPFHRSKRARLVRSNGVVSSDSAKPSRMASDSGSEADSGADRSVV